MTKRTAADDSSTRRRVLLAVIDGLGAASLRRAIDDGHAPMIASLIAGGATMSEAISPYPSLTPVCLSTIITGALPDRHRIPSLGWYNRGEHRFVEYGSSFAAAGVEGAARTIEDVILNLNHVHLAEDPPTLFERFQDAGREAASVNFLLWRGRTRHTMKHDYSPISRLGKRRGVHAVYGPDHLYFGELYGRSRPVLPQVGIKRPLDWGGANIARWLLKNTATEFLLLYLGQLDAASHKLGPDDTQRAIRAADRALGIVVESVGGVETFLEQFGFVLCADHAQTAVMPGQSARIEEVFDDTRLFRGSRSTTAAECELAIAPSNRFAMAYRLDGRRHAPSERWVSQRAQEASFVDITAFVEGDRVVVHRGEGELRFHRTSSEALGASTERARREESHERWVLEGDLSVLDIDVSDGEIGYGDYPDALRRLEAALACVNSGDVLIDAALGWDFVDIGGGSHDGGGSHGSLHGGDSVAAFVTSGIPGMPDQAPGWWRLADIAPMIARGSALGATDAPRGATA